MDIEARALKDKNDVYEAKKEGKSWGTLAGKL